MLLANKLVLRKMDLRFWACLPLILVVFVQIANADVCSILAASLKPDVLIQGSSFEQFSQLQQLVGNSTFASWGNASDSSISGGLNIPGEVNAFLGTKSDSSNWGTNRSQFLSMNSQAAYAKGANSVRISQISVAALKIIADCAQTRADQFGFSATLDKVSDNRDSFAVILKNRTGGDPRWKLTQFSAEPPDDKLKCNDSFETASLARPRVIPTNSQLISCSKNPDKNFILGIQTTAGPASTTFTITSVHEKIQKLRDATQAQIQALATKLDKQGLVVAFAASTVLPLGRFMNRQWDDSSGALI